jgi:hypothetical protein
MRPHHTSPPRDIAEFADFCARITRRYATREPVAAQLALDRAVGMKVACVNRGQLSGSAEDGTRWR